MGLIGDTPATDDSSACSDGDDGDDDGDDGDDGDTQPEDSNEPAITPRPGETMADAICRHKCQDEYDRWQEEEKWTDELEDRFKEARRELRRLRSYLNDLERDIDELESEEAELSRYLLTPHYAPLGYREKQKLIRDHRRLTNVLRELSRLREEAQEARDEIRQERERIQAIYSSLKRQRQRRDDARQAYFDCMRKCLAAAKKAGEKTTIEIPEDG